MRNLAVTVIYARANMFVHINLHQLIELNCLAVLCLVTLLNKQNAEAQLLRKRFMLS